MKPEIKGIDLDMDIGIDENNSLISEDKKKEKENLVKILDSLKEKLEKEENKGIEDVYEEYNNYNEMSEREISNKRGKIFLHFNFYFLLPLSVIINLNGIFFIKSIMNVVYDFFFYSIKSFFFDNNDKQYSNDKDENFCYFYNSPYNFYKSFYKYSLNKNLDFNLIMFMDFLGKIILKWLGFKISSLIFLLINNISLFLIYNFDFSEYKKETGRYTIFQLGYILACWGILLVGVGCSALLSQHILIDSYIKYRHYKKSKSINILRDENNDNDSLARRHEKKTFDFFIAVCITTIFGKYFKYFLSIILIELIGNKNENDNFIINYNTSNICTNETIFNITQNNYAKDRQLFNYVIMIYILFIILSIITYWFFTCCTFNKVKKDRNQKNKNSIFQIFGYTIFCQNKIIEEENEKNKKVKCECIKLCGKSLKNCSNNCLNVIIGDLLNVNQDNRSNCAICCCEYNDVSYEQKDIDFCYCYQGKSICKWFNDYITSEIQIKVTPLIFFYIIMKGSSFGFVKIFNEYTKEHKEKDDLEDFLIIFVTFFFFLIIPVLFSYCKDIFQFRLGIINIRKISNSIIEGKIVIVFFNCFYSLIFSLLYLCDIIKDEHQYYLFIIIPIYMVKYYYFTLINYSLSYSNDRIGLELISGATLISIYIYILDLIFKLCINNLDIKFLLIAQIIFSLFPVTIFIILIIYIAVTFIYIFVKAFIRNCCCCCKCFSYCFSNSDD